MIRFKAEVRDSFGSPCRSWCARPKASFLSLFELSKGKESSHEVPLDLCRGVEFAINPLPSWSAARYSRELAPVILHAGKTSALSF